MFRIERRQQIFAIFRPNTQKLLSRPARVARRSSWSQAFTAGLAELGSQRAMPGAQLWSSNHGNEKH